MQQSHMMSSCGNILPVGRQRNLVIEAILTCRDWRDNHGGNALMA
jgi:hypothetical protein